LPTSNGGPYSGDLTYYNPGLGSCGYTNTESEHVCAVSHILFDAASTSSNPNDNPLCGLKVRIRRDGESVDAKVVDRCVGCAETDLDVTESVFGMVAELAQGRVTMEWAWLEKAPVNASSQRRDTNMAPVDNHVDLHV
jgi:expansin (peptidoglycan-binding protein)